MNAISPRFKIDGRRDCRTINKSTMDWKICKFFRKKGEPKSGSVRRKQPSSLDKIWDAMADGLGLMRHQLSRQDDHWPCSAEVYSCRLCRSTKAALAIGPTSRCGAWTAPCVPVESRRAKRISDGRRWTNSSPLFPRSLFINYYKIHFSAWSKQRSRRKLFIKSRDVISQMLVERFRPRTTR